MVNPYSKERKEAREKARKTGMQTTQRSWDNYSLGKQPEGGQQAQSQQINSGEITKIVNDAVSSIRQSIINEVTQSVVSTLRGKTTEENVTSESKINSDIIEPVKAPLFNYEIFSPNNGPRCAIILEIPQDFFVEKLHVLGIQGQTLRWVETQDC